MHEEGSANVCMRKAVLCVREAGSVNVCTRKAVLRVREAGSPILEIREINTKPLQNTAMVPLIAQPSP